MIQAKSLNVMLSSVISRAILMTCQVVAALQNSWIRIMSSMAAIDGPIKKREKSCGRNAGEKVADIDNCFLEDADIVARKRERKQESRLKPAFL